MTNKNIELSEEELKELVSYISVSTLEHLTQKIQSKVLRNKQYENMPINSFITVVMGSVGVINAGIINWLARCADEILEVNVDDGNIRLALVHHIKHLLGITEH